VVLPAEIAVFVSADYGARRELNVGDAAGGPLYLSGSVELRASR
jgi:hypothetical protein